MLTYSVEILNPKAVKLLEDLADLDLITINPRTTLAKQAPLSDEERAKAHERIMRGGSQTLDVDEMIAYIKEDRPMPFRENG